MYPSTDYYYNGVIGLDIVTVNRDKVQNGEYVDLNIFLENPSNSVNQEKRLAFIWVNY